MKRILAVFFLFYSYIGYSQSVVLKTDMPAAFCQVGTAFIDSIIWVPLTIENPVTHQFYSTVEKYDAFGVRLDSISVFSSSQNYYSVHSVFEDDGFLFVAGLKNTCSNPSDFFLGKVNLNTKTYQEIKSYPAPSNQEIIKGIFNAGFSRKGFYTDNDIFIADFVNDTLHHVFSKLGGVAGVEYFNNNIIVGSSQGLMKLNPTSIYSADTLIAEMVREMTIDFKTKQIYTASNFFLIRVNQTWQIQDSMFLANSQLNLGAPQKMIANNNRLFLLDGNKIYVTDSNFSFVTNPFTIALETGDTQIKKFKLSNNRLFVFGVKGHFYSPKSSYPWFIGSYPLTTSQVVNPTAKINYCHIDTLVKVNVNGNNFLKAKFTFSVSNTSASIVINRFAARFYINGSLCSGLKNLEHFNNLQLKANTTQSFSTDWLSFGPVVDITQFNSSNTRFTTTISAINKTDYSSTLNLSVTTQPYGYLNIYEDTFAVNITPNPFNNQLKIEGNFFSNTSVLLFDSNGREVWKGVLKKKKTTIKLPKLESGIYFIWINNGKDSFVQKLVKQ